MSLPWLSFGGVRLLAVAFGGPVALTAALLEERKLVVQ